MVFILRLSSMGRHAGLSDSALNTESMTEMTIVSATAGKPAGDARDENPWE